MKHKKLWIGVLLALTVLWIAFIFRNSLQTAEVSSQESGELTEIFRVSFSGITHHFVRKLAHFTEFFVLCILLWYDVLLICGRRTVWPLWICLAVSLLDECIQTLVPGRTGRLSDVILDMLGACAAFLLLRGVGLLRRRRKQKNLRKEQKQKAGAYDG